MKALYFDKSLQLGDYPKPKRSYNEALIRVLLAGICNTDLEIVKGYGGFKGVLGHEFVGVVDACNNSELLEKRVVGEINCACGKCKYCLNGLNTHCKDRTVLGIQDRHGAFAEYLILPEDNLHLISDNISDEEAVFVEPLAAAFQITQQLHIRPRDRVVVLGDGKLGLLVAQVLYLTCCNLLVVGKHPSKLFVLQDKGIRTSLIGDLKKNEADIVIESTGSHDGLDMALRLIRPKGTIVLKSTIAKKGAFDLTSMVVNEITIVGSRCGPFPPAIRALGKRMVDVKSLISNIYSIDNGIDAFKQASKKGVLKILIKMNGN
ncbi:MAG: alcohol dehydrogenase catalytic domain-containing protein [Thermodesulfobacteriota bacterium]|nr:alcohol dehydrogenase catalytic domain-containing protein [Thermodesulfobacteriota bacterium]